MSDDLTAIVTEIKIEHLGLRGMTMIPSAAFERRPVSVASDILTAMRRRAIVPEYELPVDLKAAA